jgi:TatD DNase family protein
MIDAHCHLADEVYEADLDEVIARAREAGVTAALCILDAGSNEEARRATRITERWPAVRFATGVHPHQAGRHEQDTEDAGRVVAATLAANTHVRALGEMGLDYHYDLAPRSVQQGVFASQVRLARERDLPIVIHTREADADTVRILRDEGNKSVRGVFHCFTGGDSLARAALDLGFHLSFSGIVTFPKAQALRDVAAFVPDDRLLIETDSPFLAPVPYRGKRNEPAWVTRVAEVVAHVRRVTTEALVTQTSRNFTQLFRP